MGLWYMRDLGRTSSISSNDPMALYLFEALIYGAAASALKIVSCLFSWVYHDCYGHLWLNIVFIGRINKYLTTLSKFQGRLQCTQFLRFIVCSLRLRLFFSSFISGAYCPHMSRSRRKIVGINLATHAMSKLTPSLCVSRKRYVRSEGPSQYVLLVSMPYFTAPPLPRLLHQRITKLLV